MPEVKIRKFLTIVEEIYHEGGRPVEKPLLRGAIVAVIDNPFAGSYHEEITGFMKDLEPLGLEMATRLVGALGGAKAIVPSSKKVGGPGTRLDVPITHINASYVRSHFDAMEVGVPDGPRSNEMAVVLVMTTGARIHNRAGGLKAADIKGEDGLR